MKRLLSITSRQPSGGNYAPTNIQSLVQSVALAGKICADFLHVLLKPATNQKSGEKSVTKNITSCWC